MIVVSDRGRIIRVPVADVLYMKAELKYVTLRTADHTHVLDDSLAELEERLGDRFLRVHRNALVAKRAVRALERRAIVGENADDGLEGWARVHRPGQRMAGGVAAPGRRGARGAGHRRAVTGARPRPRRGRGCSNNGAVTSPRRRSPFALDCSAGAGWPWLVLARRWRGRRFAWCRYTARGPDDPIRVLVASRLAATAAPAPRTRSGGGRGDAADQGARSRAGRGLRPRLGREKADAGSIDPALLVRIPGIERQRSMPVVDRLRHSPDAHRARRGSSLSR